LKAVQVQSSVSARVKTRAEAEARSALLIWASAGNGGTTEFVTGRA
jgi:hypothetical protein